MEEDISAGLGQEDAAQKAEIGQKKPRRKKKARKIEEYEPESFEIDETRVASEEIMPYLELKEKIEALPDGRDKGFICLMYAGLARVGEICRRVRQRDVNRRERRKWAKNKKGRKPRRKTEYRHFLGMRVKDIRRDADGCIILRLYTEKNPRQRYREVPLPQREEWLAQPILKLYEGRHPESAVAPAYGNAVFKNISRQRAWKIIKKKLGIHPHLLRHMRTTHLLSGEAWGKPVSLPVVKAMGGWAELQSLGRYEHVGLKENARQFWE